MTGIASQVPPWAVALLFICVSTLGGLVLRFVLNRYARLEGRVDKLETGFHCVETELQKKADYKHLEKEVEKLADRNHSDLKDIQRQIAESMKTMHGRLDDLHVIFINFLNSKKQGD